MSRHDTVARAVRAVRTVAAIVFGAAATAASAQRPTLVVMITVDQMRADYLSVWRSQFTGGLARILRDGAVFTNAFQDHANTETAPGHAAILSGRYPYSTGIIANARGVNTPDAPLLESSDTGASPMRFHGTTLADWMHARAPATRVLSVSRKDRAAILPVAPSHWPTALWYSPRQGVFTTSTWYASALPAWVKEFNAERATQRLAGRAWTLLLPESAYPEPDSVAGEARNNVVFPHTLSADTARARVSLPEFPWMDSVTLALALRGVGAMELGAGDNRTDLLAVSLSTTDAIGHRWGPDSRELHDMVLRVDRYLGAFLDSLYALRGQRRVIVALTADHGVAPAPEIASRFEHNEGATHVPATEFRPALTDARGALRSAGLDTTALRWEDLVLWLNHGLLNKPFAADALARAFAAATRTLPGVQRSDVVADLAHADTVADPIARRWLHMFTPGVDAYPGEIPLVAVTLAPLSVLGRGDVATHGTPHDYDAHVPVAFLGAPFKPGERAERVGVVDIAPTLAAVLGIKPSEHVDGRILKEALR
ncbi:MAG TPA: alkaline phosphatase family protein [Gemmatimonadaceae bacterium]|nr:alkaline phosphatase family protein [Gemmatimonadaceae bacterium]